MKIVILDDNESVHELLRRAVATRGHDVFGCDSPFALTPLLMNVRPDLLLVDVDMPALRGDVVIEAIHHHQLDTFPIVLYSGRPESELAVLARRAGASGYISKDVVGAELGRRVQSFLAAK